MLFHKCTKTGLWLEIKVIVKCVFSQNFTIIYIKMGYPRLEVGKQCELAPTLLTAMEGKPQPQQDRWGHSLTVLD